MTENNRIKADTTASLKPGTDAESGFFRFWYGSTLIGKREYDMFKFFLCFMAVIFGP